MTMSEARVARRAFFLMACALPIAASAQRGAQQPSERLQGMPGYARYAQMAPQLGGAVKSGAVQAAWADDSKSFTYTAPDGKRMRFDIAAMKASEAPADAAAGGTGGRGRGNGRGGAPGVERGRQATFANSPDGKFRATYRDNNLWISDTTGGNSSAITTDGSKEKRIKYGTGSWVYGEELGQTTAMWWSPDGTKLAYYRFDETPVKDYYLQMNQTQVYDSLDIEAYPKSGTGNPIVDLFVYDVATKKSTHIDVRDGKPFANETVGYYVYRVNWTRDSKELLVNRTNRRQNIMEFTACDPGSAKCRAIVREEWPTGWVDNTPDIRWLADGKRFVWTSERTGFANFYLYDISGKLLSTITKGPFEVQAIAALDEPTGVMFYTARDGDNFMKTQLHRVKLDGTGDVRLTEAAFTHTASLSPDRRYFVDVAQTHDQAPVSRLVDASNGKVLAELAKSDLAQFTALGLRKAEMFTYLAADGKTTLHGIITFPSNFDPNKKYPTLVPVYGGPASGSNTANESFKGPVATAEYGFLIVNLNSRATPGMGKRTLDALYLKLGQTEMDDMAEGVKALWNRPYFDKARVGIYGTSYGGYTSAMEIVRHPEVFAAATAGSPVTDWHHYDTIYTERYMWIPQENDEGYKAGSVMTYAPNLKGRLMLYYGTADNNVHPNNMMQLIKALNDANKSYEVQVGPDFGHSGLGMNRMMEFFIENLVMKSGSAAQH
jgi:dipeptidyl-peptidase-4